MSANLIIGSSHALNFSQAIGDFSATLDEAKNNLVKIDSRSGNDNYLLYVLPNPEFIHLRKIGADSWEVKFDRPIDEIRKFNENKSKVIFMLGGNEPNGHFFYKNPKPFDFFHPEHLEADVRKQILPLAQMKAIVDRLISITSLSTKALAKQLPLAKKYYIAPPPPIPSSDHIKKYPEIFDFKTREIEDKSIRLKIYKIQIQNLINICKEADIEFVGSGTSRIDDNGFLREEYWEGCTHATVDYYMSIVEKLRL